MISLSRLRQGLRGDWVVFDENSELLETPAPTHLGPAVLVVSAMTEAVKRQDEVGKVVESVDRERMWVVDAIVLNRVVVESLVEEDMTAEGLLDAVRAMGLTWQVSSTSVP